tara:strand:- start:22476 stop:22715 length:240 start_codon:yes stop_codon:yes gene_type:complete
MTNNEKLVICFMESLNINKEIIVDSLEYQGITQWDSMAHMMLVAEIETKFDIMLDTEEILAMSSVEEIKKILGSHDITF